MGGSTGCGVRIFISYSHEDRELKEQLNKSLSALRRSSKVEVWSDREIAPSADWHAELAEELHAADVILLLISADFNASDFIWDEELAVAMRRHEEGTAKVVPVILRDCSWKDLPYAKLQALPTDGKAITLFENRDQALTEVAQGVEFLVNAIAESRLVAQ